MKKIKCETCNKEFKNENALEMHYKSKHYKESKISGKTIFIAVAILAIISITLFITLKKNDIPTNNPINTQQDSSIQKRTLSFGNNYAPNTIEVKQGIPVEITLDDSVGGCYRSFAIPQFQVSKYSKSPDDKIIFTPDKAGTFRFRCGMGMGTGTIVVTE